MHQVVTLQGWSRHLNLCRAEAFRHQRCLLLPFILEGLYHYLKQESHIHTNFSHDPQHFHFN